MESKTKREDIVNATMEINYDVIDGLDLKTFRPMPKHVIVRWKGRKETKGGILMPQTRERMGIMNGEILAFGDDCDVRLDVGQRIQFSGLCTKEFIGAECPGDRDPVFFMAECDIVGYMIDGTLYPINEYLFIRPDKEAAERSGIKIVNRDKQGIIKSGVVVRYDAPNLVAEDIKEGDRVFYHSGIAEEIKLGDFDGELIHAVQWRNIEILVEGAKNG